MLTYDTHEIIMFTKWLSLLGNIFGMFFYCGISNKGSQEVNSQKCKKIKKIFHTNMGKNKSTSERRNIKNFNFKA